MRLKGKPTRKEAKQQLVNDYIAAGHPWPIDLYTLAEWAYNTGRARHAPQSHIKILAKEIQAALREEMYTDPQGRRVRKKHAFPKTVQTEDGPVQKMFWTEHDTGEPADMRKSFQWRRRQILGDSNQLKIDVDSYNENNKHGAHIQMHFNFEADLIELEHDTEYNPPPKKG